MTKSALRTWVLNILATIFVVASLLRMVGKEFGFPGLVRNTIALTFAPAPNPFRAVQKNKPRVDRGLAFGCENAQGDMNWNRFDYTFRNRIDGPHRRTAVYLHLSEKVNNPRLATTRDIKEYLHYGWCNDGPLARAADCRADLDEFIMRRKSNDEKQKVVKCRS